MNSQKLFDLPFRQFSLMAFFRLCRFTWANDVHIIHSHGRGAGYYSRLLRLVLPGRKVIHTHHGFYYQHARGVRRVVLVAIEKLLSKMTDAFVFVSRSEISAAASVKLFYPGKSHLIPNGIDVIPLQTRSDPAGVAKLITVTRLEPEKGNDILIRMMATLRNLNKKFLLRIIGDGPERSRLEAMAADNDLQEYIHFLGARDDVADWLRESDIFISSSFGEAQGIAVIEAMMHGVPVVVSKVMGHVDTVEDGRTGLMFSPDAPAQGAAQVVKLMSDVKLWSELRRNAYESVQNKYSIHRMAQQVETLYHQVLGEQAR
jgi:glycosyltransferase involved in cell wall biosynthesis